MENTPNEVLTSLITSLKGIDVSEARLVGQTPGTTQEPFFSAIFARLRSEDQGQLKNVLLTFHFLFPHELLPALDLLDRKLITCSHLRQPTTAEPVDVTDVPIIASVRSPSDFRQIIPESIPLLERFYVQSASSVTNNSSRSASSTSRYRNAYNTAGTYYEVCLDGWNCSCPAFAFSSMKLMMAFSDESEARNLGARTIETSEGIEDQGWRFGGSATQSDAVVPICKHILAVALAKGAPNLFGDSMSVQEVSKEEIAGRAAGYGGK